MGFLDSLKSLTQGGGGSSDDAYHVYVRCKRCGEAIQTRINLRNELSERDEGGFVVRKTLVGNQRCFERIEVTLFFDQDRQLVDRQAVHGDFITAEEFEAAHRS
jgi:hypothetical protein